LPTNLEMYTGICLARQSLRYLL